MDLATNKDYLIAVLPRPVYLGLTLSPDGKNLLYTQVNQQGSDLMLLEPFR